MEYLIKQIIALSIVAGVLLAGYVRVSPEESDVEVAYGTGQ